MKNVSRILPCYAADTSGVCSALYELGGMTVIHDASGCNSTYTTHDEPRWYDRRSMVFISALTEMDAIMGNDERLISDTVAAAKDLSPGFIALCGSPMPMMTGVDFDAIACEVEARSGIRTFGFHTNGTRHYTEGVSEALEAVLREYAAEMPKAEGIGVNVLGLTPLDFPLGADDSINSWLRNNGFVPVADLAMGSTLEDIKKAASAKVDLVVSSSGLAAAEYMLERFGINYVTGIPVGGRFGSELAENIRQAASATDHGCVFSQGMGFDENTDSGSTVIIGEGIASMSLARALGSELGMDCTVICPLGADDLVFRGAAKDITSEEEIEAYLGKTLPKTVIADPLYSYVVPEGTRHISLPHLAFSGRSYKNEIKDLVNTDIKELFK